MKSAIGMHRQLPTLLIDGVPTPAVAYTTYFEERSCYADFLAAGYRIFFVNASFTALPINSQTTGFTPFRVGVFENMDAPDYSDLDSAIAKILASCPDALIFPRIDVSMPKWWIDAHPEDITLTPKGGYREVLFSKAFREDGAALLRRLIAHVQQADYSHRIAGWQICGGATQEWMHHDAAGSLSPAAAAPYRRFMLEKYGIEDAVLPQPADFTYRGEVENTCENAVRYAEFCSIEVAKTIAHFAKTVKEATGRAQVVGLFYGYANFVSAPLSGTHALRCLLDSPDIDFFSSPNSYHRNRALGVDWADMLPVDSVKLHQKLCFIECDIRTHLTTALQEARPGEYPEGYYALESKGMPTVWAGPKTEQLSLEALRKCFAHQLTRGSGIWWFDMWGGWYGSPSMMAELKRLCGIYADSLNSFRQAPPAEIVCFSDERAYAQLCFKSPLYDAVRHTLTALCSAGAPFDCFTVEDAPRVLKQYKAAIFPSLVPSAAGREAMALCRANGIPYLCATVEHPSLASDELLAFSRAAGVHIFEEAHDVLYVGNGSLAIHAATGGEKRINLPARYRVTPLFGISSPAGVTDTLVFDLAQYQTVLFRLQSV